MHTAELHSMPWVIAENFNEPLSSADKLGGREVSISRSLLLKECLDKCNMADLGYSGSRFTWTNWRDTHVLIQERINRFFINTDWCSLYPEARVTHLTRCHFNHNPICWKQILPVGQGRIGSSSFKASGYRTPLFPKWSKKLGQGLLASKKPSRSSPEMHQIGIRGSLGISLRKKEELWLDWEGFKRI